MVIRAARFVGIAGATLLVSAQCTRSSAVTAASHPCDFTSETSCPWAVEGAPGERVCFATFEQACACECALTEDLPECYSIEPGIVSCDTYAPKIRR